MDELEYVEYKVNNGETESCWADNKNERIQTNSCEWIRVEDELPDHNRRVRTVSNISWAIEIHNRYNQNSKKWDSNNLFITHWQEIVLPEEDIL